jgi:hypothetical protein
MLINYQKGKCCEKISDHEWETFPPCHSQAYRFVCKKCGIGSYIGPSYSLLEKREEDSHENPRL